MPRQRKPNDRLGLEKLLGDLQKHISDRHQESQILERVLGLGAEKDNNGQFYVDVPPLLNFFRSFSREPTLQELKTFVENNEKIFRPSKTSELQTAEPTSSSTQRDLDIQDLRRRNHYLELSLEYERKRNRKADEILDLSWSVIQKLTKKMFDNLLP